MKKRPHWLQVLDKASELGCLMCGKRTWFLDAGQEVRCWNCNTLLRGQVSGAKGR